MTPTPTTAGGGPAPEVLLPESHHPESQHLSYSAQAHSGCSSVTMKDHGDPGDLLKTRAQWRRFISVSDLEKL